MNLNKESALVQNLGFPIVPPATATSSSKPKRPKKRWFPRFSRLFLFTVLLPTGLTAIYYGFIASDVYISDSSFLVESVQDQEQMSSSLGSLIKSASSGSSDDENASVQEFMQSRDALRKLEPQAGIRQAYSNDSVDRISRFGGLNWDKSFEALYDYYAKSYMRRIVTINPSDASSTISELQIRAFTAEEASLINRKLLQMGEKLVNDLNWRLQQDLVGFAEAEVAVAETKAETAYVALADYRNKNTLVDPEHQSSIQLQLILKLQEELIHDRNQLAELMTSVANNPQIPLLRDRIQNLESEIAVELTKATGTEGSLTNKASEYERLTFEKDFSEKQLGSAQAFLERARNEAQRKQLYLKRIVEPNTPDIAMEPKRIRNVIGVLILGLVSWGIISLFTAAVREHQQ